MLYFLIFNLRYVYTFEIYFISLCVNLKNKDDKKYNYVLLGSLDLYYMLLRTAKTTFNTIC
ncbi:hypothetical protein SF1_12410 [Sphingobacterium faecium NBRC 15299]|nr:hypothetical protein SF1_12410 [Sphingobacterium faecium NBRC 15299]